jgi:ribosomal protein L3 glutamine methyltransferase
MARAKKPPLLKSRLNIKAYAEALASELEAAQVHFGQGTQSAFDEAIWIILAALKLPLDCFDEVAERELGAAELAAVKTLAAERIRTRKPLAYLTREAWLHGVPFYIDERSIVPRSLIAELLADGSIDPWLSEQTQIALDLCTGNASLAVLTAMTYPDVQVFACDLSEAALEVAHINVERHALPNLHAPFQSDLFTNCKTSFDLIVCNPPYVNSQSMHALPPEFLHEPELALAGGADGMDLVRKILRDAPRYMRPNAVLVLEIGHEARFFEAAFPELETVWLETAAGPDSVCLLTESALRAAFKPS